MTPNKISFVFHKSKPTNITTTILLTYKDIPLQLLNQPTTDYLHLATYIYKTYKI